MTEYFAYQYLDPAHLGEIITPLRLSLEEILAVSIGSSEIQVNTDTGEFGYKRAAASTKKNTTKYDSQKLSLAGKYYISEINRNFNNLFQEGTATVAYLFPLHFDITNIQEKGTANGIIIEFGFYLEYANDMYLPVTEAKAEMHLSDTGDLLALYGYWLPVISRVSYPALLASDIGEEDITLLYEEDAGTEEEDDDDTAMIPDIFYRHEAMGSWLPGLNYVSAESLYYPAIDPNAVVLGSSSGAAPYQYEDTDLYKSVDEIPDSILSKLLSLGVSADFLNADITVLTGLVECMEALEIADLLHLKNNKYVLNKKYTYEDFSFRISYSNNIGKADIEMDFYTVTITVKFSNTSIERCIYFEDLRFPNKSFSICQEDILADNYDDLSIIDDVELRPAYFDENYFATTRDFFVLQKGEDGNLNIFGYDCATLSDEDRMAAMEEAKKQYNDDVATVVEGSQIQEYLDSSGMPNIDAYTSARLGINGAMVHAPTEYSKLATERHYRKRNTTKLAREAGELSLRARNLWFGENLNDTPWINTKGDMVNDNHPIWDIKGTLFGKDKLIQVKTSRSGTAASRFRTYDSGLFDIMGGLKNIKRANLFKMIALQDFAASGLSEAEILTEAKKQGILAVNDSDIGAYKDYVDTKIRSDLAKFKTYFDALLSGDELVVDGTRFKSMDEIERHSDSATKTKAITALIERVKSKIIGNGTNTSGNASLAEFHGTLQSEYNPGKNNRTTIDTMNTIAPEAGMIAHLGRSKAAIKSGMRSGAQGFFWGAGFSIVQQAAFSDSFDYGRVTVQAGASGVGDAIGTGLSTRFVPYPALLTRYGIGGAIGGRILGGGVVGAISAPVVELSTMLYDDVTDNEIDYEGYEYTSRVGSEAIGGLFVGAAAGGASAGLSAILLSAGAGAAAGSFVPVAGNIAGFVVGLAVGIAAYAFYSYFFKDAIQQEIATIHLSATDQLHTLEGNWAVTDFGYFHTVHTRATGGNDYAVFPTTTSIIVMNPVTGGSNELRKVKAVGPKAKSLFPAGRSFEFVDIRLLKKL